MIVFLGFVLQLVISLFLMLFGWATSTNMGFSDTNSLEKLLGVAIMALGAYGLYDLSTMFNYVGTTK